jgi:pimeloyl-ACP methyl ester carboxylesterase
MEDPAGLPVPAFDPAILEGLNATDPSAVPPDLWAAWRQLQAIPMLAIRGALSDILSADTMVSMGARHPNLTALTLANRGHAPMLDEPAAVAAIDEFLRRLEPR